ncbi:MAG TPA: response regulator [Gemmataceae bacterium]|jgi:two-component system chemotaxis response regulator CheY|nr:response regulator [Gemmataceae bacterium]
MRALVIDDSRAVRSILRGILRDAGFEVAEACNGREALACLDQGGVPELALVDWNMPEMDGISFVRAVRAQARFSALRLMMVTTENERVHVSGALDSGADEYVMKPFTREVILEKLELLGLLQQGIPHACPGD